MLNQELKDALKQGSLKKIFIVAECLCGVELHAFDDQMSQLVIQLKKALPEVYYFANASSEKYGFNIPELSAERMETLIGFLEESPLRFKKSYCDF